MTTSTAAAPGEQMLKERELPDSATGLTESVATSVEDHAAEGVPVAEADTTTGAESGIDAIAQRLSHRRALLDPVASRLLELLEQHREVDAPSQVNLNGSCVHVSRWERELILEHHGDGEFPDRGWVTRVMDAVSFQARVLIARGQLRRSSESGDPKGLNQLVLIAAVGLALKTELQKTVDRLIFSGEVATAKHLSQTLQRVSQALAECREALEPSQSWPAAAELAPGLTCIPQDATLPEAPARRRKRRPRQHSADELEALAELEAQPRRDAASRRHGASRIRAMAITLSVLVIAWTAVVLVPMLTSEPLKTLTITDFRTVPQVRSVSARPPSLYVIVSEREWGRLSPESRVDVVDQIGEIAGRADYSGAVLRLPGGATVARWLRAKGSSLVER